MSSFERTALSDHCVLVQSCLRLTNTSSCWPESTKSLVNFVMSFGFDRSSRCRCTFWSERKKEISLVTRREFLRGITSMNLIAAFSGDLSFCTLPSLLISTHQMYSRTYIIYTAKHHTPNVHYPMPQSKNLLLHLWQHYYIYQCPNVVGA